MKQAEVNVALANGEILMQGMYWGGRMDTLTLRDKTSGAKRTAYVLKETVMVEKGPVSVSTWMPDDYDPNAKPWKQSIDRMTKVICRISRLDTVAGNVQMSGTVEPLV
jgi:hypothetical protein